MNYIHSEEFYNKFLPTHLVCDASCPIITNSIVQEEALLYNLSKHMIDKVISEFDKITGKTIHYQSDVTELSGGQKVVLSILLALYSNAKSIIFIDIDSCLDNERKTQVLSLIDKFKPDKREILVLNS